MHWNFPNSTLKLGNEVFVCMSILHFLFSETWSTLVKSSTKLISVYFAVEEFSYAWQVLGKIEGILKKEKEGNCVKSSSSYLPGVQVDFTAKFALC